VLQAEQIDRPWMLPPTNRSAKAAGAIMAPGFSTRFFANDFACTRFSNWTIHRLGSGPAAIAWGQASVWQRLCRCVDHIPQMLPSHGWIIQPSTRIKCLNLLFLFYWAELLWQNRYTSDVKLIFLTVLEVGVFMYQTISNLVFAISVTS